MLGLFKIILFILNKIKCLGWLEGPFISVFYNFDLSMWTNMIKSSLKFEGLFQQVQYEMNLCK